MYDIRGRSHRRPGSATRPDILRCPSVCRQIFFSQWLGRGRSPRGLPRSSGGCHSVPLPRCHPLQSTTHPVHGTRADAWGRTDAASGLPCPRQDCPIHSCTRPRVPEALLPCIGQAPSALSATKGAITPRYERIHATGATLPCRRVQHAGPQQSRSPTPRARIVPGTDFALRLPP